MFKRIPMPKPLPKREHTRAMWIGYEASRWLPFDPRLYLVRSAALGAPVSLSTSGDGGVFFHLPEPSPEFEFLSGWFSGCRPQSLDMIAKALEGDEELQRLHREAGDVFAARMQKRRRAANV